MGEFKEYKSIIQKFLFNVCVWLQIKKLAYFTIQLIFATIHGSYCTF